MNNLPIETYESVVQQRDALEKKLADVVAENCALKSNLMFWDAEYPESPYDTPREIAELCSLNYNEEFVVQVAAKLANRTYRVCESWESECEVELVEGAEIETPATDEFTRELMAKGVESLLTESFREEIAGALADFDGMDEKSLQTLIWSGQPPEPDGDVWCVEYMTRAAAIQSKIRDFAAQLRKGINDAQ